MATWGVPLVARHRNPAAFARRAMLIQGLWSLPPPLVKLGRAGVMDVRRLDSARQQQALQRRCPVGFVSPICGNCPLSRSLKINFKNWGVIFHDVVEAVLGWLGAHPASRFHHGKHSLITPVLNKDKALHL
jgi:hypothetical protein